MMHPDLNRALRWAPLALALCVLGAVILKAPGRQRSPMPPASVQTAPENAPAPAGATLTELASWPLFGSSAPLADGTTEQDQGPGTASASVLDESVVLPVTALDVQVRGLAYATTPQRAHAILQVNGQAQQRYRVGDALTDGVTLAGVRPLEVVISNQGRLESAALPVAPAELSVPPVSVLPAPASLPDARARALENAYRQRGGAEPGFPAPPGRDSSVPIDESFP